MKHYDRVLLLNNTENYHYGCKEVINFYRRSFPNIEIVTKDQPQKYNISEYDLVIANGEGTMHNNAPKAIKILDRLCAAKKSMLVNTVWQNNNQDLADKLHNIDFISVREVKSQKEILKQTGIQANIELDYSYYRRPKIIKKTKKNIIAGNRMHLPNTKPKRPKIKNVGEDGYIDIFTQSWQDIVSQLSVSKLLITGRHHEMYAACVAECPCIVIEGNTYKNQGLFETAGVNIPVLQFNSDNNAIIKAIKNIENYQDEFEKLFEFMKNQKIPDLQKYAKMV
jgi:polysaccharide pyruvyl transferase WcaK-like protein